MHDFSCTYPDDMNYDALAKKARYFKQDEKGVAAMSKILEEIADCVPSLSIDELKKLEAEVMQLT